MNVPPEGAVTGHLDERLAAICCRHPVVGLAVGVVRDGRLSSFHGLGLADIASGTPVTQDTVFRIGSITKTFTAIAVLQLCEQGLVDLDAPAGEYLRAYRLIPAKPGHRPPTVRQLLTHTAGLPQLVYPVRAFQPVLGETLPYGQPVPALAEFYRGRLALIAEPGTRHTYSNHGFATLGQIVEDVTGQPLRRCFAERIFGPLGITGTDLARSDRMKTGSRPGTPCEPGPRPVRDCDLVTAGAGAIYSTARDMARYAAALLAGGSGEHGQILKAETVTSIFAPHYQPDPRLPGVGLAFFRRDLGGHLLAGHDGLVPGFTSQMSLAPDDGTGVVAFTNGAHGAMAWLGGEVTALLGGVLGVPEPVIRADVPHHPEIWTGICGWYSFRGSLRDAQKWLISGAEVFVRRGQLILRPVTPLPALARGLPMHPDDPADPYVFRIDLSRFGIGTSRLMFSRSPHAGVTAFHLDLDIAPLSFDKQPATRDPRYWVTGAFGAVAAATTANAVRRHRQYAPLRARGRALAAAAAATPGLRRHDLPHQRTEA